MVPAVVGVERHGGDGALEELDFRLDNAHRVCAVQQLSRTPKRDRAVGHPAGDETERRRVAVLLGCAPRERVELHAGARSCGGQAAEIERDRGGRQRELGALANARRASSTPANPRTHLVFAAASTSPVLYSTILSSPPTSSKPDDAPSFEPTATNDARAETGLHANAPPFPALLETFMASGVGCAATSSRRMLVRSV